MSADIEGGWKARLRADTGVQAECGSRIFLRADSKAAFPQVVVTLVTSRDDDSEVEGLETALVQFDIWGELNDRRGCHQAKGAVKDAIRAVRGGRTTFTDGAVVPTTLCYILGVPRVVDDRYLPDPANLRPRYALTVECVAQDPTIT